ncbi:ABC transporter ATP-binding protein [Martelella sp. HB161492]|uniref:dipeptide ABC transporter ATP-binding protein n=1 Tax=Martelella sp. HB161492 TaxID=2720726 RepID=UPI00159164F7|nr:ABC transporter ATP-binding protein [Martelella sp. HB161492]
MPKQLLNGISLDINPGETLCLVGESGSGKSLTSLSIMGLLPQRELAVTSGTISLDGENLLNASAKRLRQLRATRMAMIFQEPMTALNPVMTVGEQLDEVLAIHTSLGRSERRRRVIAALDDVHLPDPERLAQRFPHQLSGGQRQRIMIAMALALEPKLLIADEPTTALDVTTQAQILKLIKELQERHGTAVLFITHDMGVVADIADRVLVMRKGSPVEEGAARMVISEPKETYTRELLAAIPTLRPRPATTSHKTVPALSVARLCKTFSSGRHTVNALKDVSITLHAGRTLGIVGESGSGKSTLARCIMGLEEATSGTIRIDGADMSTANAETRRLQAARLQMVFQDPNRSLNPRRTVMQSVTEGAINFGTSRSAAMEKAGRLIEMVGLPAASLERYPHQFSGGQRQRIALARALMMDPEVIVADEAVSALDVSVQAQVLDLLESLQQRFGLAILFITHDLRVAARLCDDIVVMQRGVAVEAGPAESVLVQPQSDYTRSLLDAVPGKTLDQVTSFWANVIRQEQTAEVTPVP